MCWGKVTTAWEIVEVEAVQQSLQNCVPGKSVPLPATAETAVLASWK